MLQSALLTLISGIVGKVAQAHLALLASEIGSEHIVIATVALPAGLQVCTVEASHKCAWLALQISGIEQVACGAVEAGGQIGA